MVGVQSIAISASALELCTVLGQTWTPRGLRGPHRGGYHSYGGSAVLGAIVMGQTVGMGQATDQFTMPHGVMAVELYNELSPGSGCVSWLNCPGL